MATIYSSAKFLFQIARLLGVTLLGFIIYLIALVFAVFGRPKLRNNIHAFLRKWGVFAPESTDEIASYVERYFLYRGLKPLHVIRVVAVKRIWGNRMSFIEEEMAGLSHALKSDFLLTIAKKDDLGLVLSATNMLDQFLGVALISRFPVELTKTTYARVFAPNAPLGAFSAKIHLASVLGVIIGDMGNDLAILRKIRNDYAHDIHSLPLAAAEMSRRCASLKLKQDLNQEILDACGTAERQKIVASVASMLIFFSVLLHRARAERKTLLAHVSEVNTEMRAGLASMSAIAKRDQGGPPT